jgi:hypothetical protein
MEESKAALAAVKGAGETERENTRKAAAELAKRRKPGVTPKQVAGQSSMKADI